MGHKMGRPRCALGMVQQFQDTVWIQHPCHCAEQKRTTHHGFYIIVRGGLDMPLVIGDVPLPKEASQLQKFEGRMDNLEVLDLVSVPKGHEGLVFMTTLTVNNWQRGRLPRGLPTCLILRPSMARSSARLWNRRLLRPGWYFNAGEFHLPVAGESHRKSDKGKVDEGQRIASTRWILYDSMMVCA